ncbi:MAG: tRNA uridine-5-carboxymethylaminomethyl(34) synthesis GTPase MnmE [Syntrophales bacterium]|nr:tRNA uridine-5-carboxymethylaminomethyl(34) synthesis GTPase MnmE [Syntrophales bacterium]MDP3096926.1 tRNA uridine-5-carboxymethylaminomethyl(34) synthesis GTPase MnmE [Syntrophales bacterium]
MTFRDTIAAIATPPGIGGVGLIRVSGPTAEGIAQRLFRPLPPGNFLSHHLYHGKIIAPTTGAILDEVLVAFLKGPHSYTGEDTLEISCHGGPLILRTVLEAVFQTGARPAERGEFTRRAFLNNRLDLAQAEAVLDIITAKTRPGLAAAIDCLGGKLSEPIEAIRSEMIDLLAGVEAAIDFSEDDGVEETTDEALPRIRKLIDKIAALAATHRQGRIYREGIGVVIAGRPNVGKSSLLNRILGEKRAIVTPIPGTTRDFIEETVDIGGIPVRLTDTAGLRLPENAIEKEGIDLVWERLKTADAVLVLLDGSADLTADDRKLLAKMISKPMIAVLNKSDLPQRLDEKSLLGLLPEGTPPAIRISAKYGDGLDRLTTALRDLVLATPAEELPEAMIAHLHQKTALEKASAGLARAREGLLAALPHEFVALEVREALNALGEITGKTTSEEVLDRIFANFCIGK